MTANRENRPNVILCMTDDQGWGDAGFRGHPVLRTPHLDRLAAEGVRFDRFYSGAPVCSPTRGSCLTGRHPHRYGIFFANEGHLPPEEVTLAEALKTQGYATGHFGKWHLGTLTREVRDSNRGGPDHPDEYAPPWDRGFDVCFTTEARVPTWDPMRKPVDGSWRDWEYLRPGQESELYGTRYWTGPGQAAPEAELTGCDSKLIMDRALAFIRACAVSVGKPFLAVIWFHAPHLPVVAGPPHAEWYAGQDLYHRNYYGCISAMDEQVGRLRSDLEALGIADDTMLWFCSDNGPEGADDDPGSTGGLRGRKRSLLEGGVRVPGLLRWARRFPEPRIIDVPCSTSDYFPTVLDVLGFRMHGQPEPIDGISLLALLDGRTGERGHPIGFESRKQVSWMNDRHKLISTDAGETYLLFDVPADPAEQRDLAADRPDTVAAMRTALQTWRAGCDASRRGADYGERRC